MSEEEGGRVFFARPRRVPDRDTETVLLSVGVDIGSATAHLVFSRLNLVRRGSSAHLRASDVVHDSEILLTPYAGDGTIDAEALGRFITRQYEIADVAPEMVDTGALILTGLAAGTRDAQAIGALFAGRAGQFVAVAAGDALETVLSAHGSGAVAASADGARVMNIDIGGGTSKIALCADGTVADITALDIGARLVRLAPDGSVAHIEPAASRLAAESGLALGAPPPDGALEAIAGRMAMHLFEAIGGAAMTEATRALHRLPPLRPAAKPDVLSLSGGVAEYIHGRETRRFGDLGPLLADAVRARLAGWGPVLLVGGGIRATVIGASQNTVQVSGATIFVDPPELLPLHGLAVVAPDLPLDAETLDPDRIAAAIRDALARLGFTDKPVALFYRFRGSATHARLDALCLGIGAGLTPLPARGLPLVLVGDGDVGGLVGVRCRELQLAPQIVSIDGIALRDLDVCDIGTPLDASGALPVVIRSLVFPASAAQPALSAR